MLFMRRVTNRAHRQKRQVVSHLRCLRFPARIRRKQGMERLRELGHYFQHQKVELATRMESLFRVQARLAEIDALKKDVKRLDFEAGLVFRDQEKLRARDAVQKRVDALLAELERTAEQID